MRSIIAGMGALWLCIITFVICATIQINANATIAVTNAANEAAYQAMIDLTENDTVSTDEQLEEDYVRNAGKLLEGSTYFDAYGDSE